MRSKLWAGAAIAVVLAGSLVAASPAEARWRGRGGGAFIGGLAAGALIGGAFAASRPYYGYGPYYGGYGPPYYGPPPVYAAPGGDDDAYCFSRYKSYDPASGTYLGYDGYRHPCP
jgi:hypothetical protein